MKKNSIAEGLRMLWPKFNYTLKLSLITLLFSVLSIQASASSQSVKVSIDEQQISLKRLFNKIEKITEYSFLYHVGDIDLSQKVNVEAKDEPLEDILTEVFSTTGIDFSLNDTQIILKPSKPSLESTTTNPRETKNVQSLVNGRITNVDGEPLMGVTVRIKDKNRGVITDENGKYTITAAIGETLEYSYIGYEKVSVKISDEEPLDIVMKESVSGLDAVQVTAYGKTSKRLTTGNIVTITGEEIQKSPVTNVLEAVQGKVPGVFIQQTNGQPGSPVSIQMRGQNSISAVSNRDPLVVIDGVRYPYGSLPTASETGTLSGGNALNFIDPNNIENINFLKDADATAIYGSQGSNGVIVITTKKGRVGKAQISFSSRNGVSFRGKSPELLNTEDYLNFRREAIENAGLTPGVGDWDVNGRWDPNNQTDWTDNLLDGAAFTTVNNVSYSGGSENVSYVIRANYNSQENIQNANGDNETGGLHFNLNLNSNDRKFNLGLTGTYNTTKNTIIPFNNSYLLYAPNGPDVYNEDGSLNWTDYDDTNVARNPASIYELIHENKTDNLISNLDLKYIPVKGLEISTLVGINILSSNEVFAKPDTYYHPNSWQTSSSELSISKMRTLTIEPNISYNTSLGDFGEITAKVGATIMDKLTEKSDIYGTELLNEAVIKNPTMADPENINSKYRSLTNRYIGAFGILNYNLANRYLLNFNIRRDGSTKFGSGNRFGTFWSIGAGWILSEENWFAESIDFISFAKLRGSYGTSGIDGINNYQYKTIYNSGFSYNGNRGFLASGPANPNLHWEKTKKSEIAVNLELFEGRVAVTESYYDNTSNDQLVAFPLSIVTGVNTVTMNSPAEVRNWGHEITLNTKNIVSDNFNWSTSFNITVAKNKLVSYPNGEAALPSLDYKIGESVNGKRLYNYQGVNPETGNYNFWKDLNGDGQITDNEIGEWESGTVLNNNIDRTEFVDLNPKFFGGFQNSFNYKNFNLSVLFTFTKRKALNFVGSQSDQPGTMNMNIAKEIYDARWQQPGDITNVAKPRAGYLGYTNFANFKASTGAYSDATYARLQNVNLSYDFPSEITDKINFNSIRVYLQGQNLLTISNYDGYDPETLAAGAAPLRTVVFGLNFTL
ncbi:SusC/RagA family TonB-linked outer membrane protein [Zunongwangia endophytica]|uniref:SusC/RagA family TonB-linked outer membrane protein n=1 Tax=Zunongwangia endophytica TaxID=1808945 RepID=A0ABV8H571_9FLAO|nr:SusC/RagA family TonB-linked outer membrane protein [Zunongwangia endophytica]MDN3595231.1 SusC/RagA family TonB-linked outer membrane protein [Zunongwangia endophytica]